MHESSRRRVLAGICAGVAGLLAGCGAPSNDGGTEAPSPTPAATPAIPADAPDFWGWLPTPAAFGTDPYSLGALDLTTLRSADMAQRNLKPARYTPGLIHDSLDATDRLLTLSTSDVGAGVLAGEYDTAAIESRLTDAGLTPTDDGGFSGDEGQVQIQADRLLWANASSGATETMDRLRGRLAGDGEPLPATEQHLARVLEALRGRAATFVRPFTTDEGAFSTAHFLGTGIGFEGEIVRWRTVVAFEGAPTTAAREHYQYQFEDKQGFSNVRTRTSEGLLVLDAETSVAWATSTQPI